MKIVMYSPNRYSTPRIGVLYKDLVIDLVESYRMIYNSEPPTWFYDIGDFFSSPYTFKIVEEILGSISKRSFEEKIFTHDPEKIIYHPPTSKDQRIFCLALNYRSHVEESGRPKPERPYIFLKTKSALIGHKQPILIPKVSKSPDHEVELGVVIGRKGKYINRSNAMEYVAGYTIVNDISFRDWQMRSQQGLGLDWLHGKNMDSSTPVGPYVVTKDEIDDPYSLELILRVNDEVRQKGSSSEMIFSIEEIIEEITQGIKILPGDIISTGTPAGVGHARKIYLKDGDIVEAEISRIGVLANPVKAE